MAILLTGCDFGQDVKEQSFAETTQADAEAVGNANEAEAESDRAAAAKGRETESAAFTIIGWNVESGGNDHQRGSTVLS